MMPDTQSIARAHPGERALQVELRPQRPLLFRRDTEAELMYGHRPPLRVPGVGGLMSSQRRHAPIALQYTKVGGDERRLKDAVIARNGVEQRLELGQLFKLGMKAENEN